MIGDRRSVPKALIVLGSTAFSPSPACPAFRAQHLAFRFHASSATHASPPQDNCSALWRLCASYVSSTKNYPDPADMQMPRRYASKSVPIPNK